jgi:rod shape-determining protein MreD
LEIACFNLGKRREILKKVLINVALVATFLIIYFLQVNLFSWFKIAGIMPNLFVILVFYIGLFMGKSRGMAYGIIFGILLDLFVGEKVGITAIMLGIVGIIGGVLDKNFSKDSRLTIMIMVVVSTILYEVGIYILRYFMLSASVEILSFLRILIIETFYNTLLTIILYPLIQKSGHYIEVEYKENKILTRYF